MTADRQAELTALHRVPAGELSCEIPVVVSNHPDLEHVAAQFGVPFRWLPLDRTQGGKPAQEAALEAVLRELDIDTIVLARYMQVSNVFRSWAELMTVLVMRSLSVPRWSAVLLTDLQQRLLRKARRPYDQHTPLLPASLRGRSAVPSRAWCVPLTRVAPALQPS